jgi:hypothetical protein
MMRFSIIACAMFLFGIAFAVPVEMDLRQDVRPMILGVSRASSRLLFRSRSSSLELP